MQTDVANSNDVLNCGADIIIPCALGGTITREIAESGLIGTSMICGAANNQLESDDVAQILHDRGIVYCPDFVVNRMGIVNCADEMYGRMKDDPRVSAHYDLNVPHSIPHVLRSIFETSRSTEVNMVTSAKEMADREINKEHPMFGQRFDQILDEVVDDFSDAQGFFKS